MVNMSIGDKMVKVGLIRNGNTSGTIESIGCLVTSVAILIAKSGVNTDINPFNPGTFVEASNENDGFTDKGKLRYNSVSKVVPNFRYIGGVNLREKSREEKLLLISQYLSQGIILLLKLKVLQREINIGLQ